MAQSIANMEANSPALRPEAGAPEDNPPNEALRNPESAAIENPEFKVTAPKDLPPCEGSDSGVEGLENGDGCAYQRALSSNSEFDALARSCSSITSCCSNYDEAYNILVRRNSTLLEDYTLRNGDITSENGSESSSVTGTSSNPKRATNPAQKKKGAADAKKAAATKDRSRSKPPITPRQPAAASRLKSTDRTPPKTATTSTRPSSAKKTTPTNLELAKRDVVKRPSSARASSNTRTPPVTPTDDGRWPSINSKPAPLMSRSLRGIIDSQKIKIGQTETKTIAQYATLPRRRKDKPADDGAQTPHRRLVKDEVKPRREFTPARAPHAKRRLKIPIYHDLGLQTELTAEDVANAMAGISFRYTVPKPVEKRDQSEQADMRQRAVQTAQTHLDQLREKYDALREQHKLQSEKLAETEERLRGETVEKEGLKEELRVNSQRVLSILGEGNFNEDENDTSDSLMVLESRFQNVSQVVIRQEEEISKLNAYCRSLQISLEKSLNAQRILVQQQHELEGENAELQEFLKAENTTLSDALQEAESELAKSDAAMAKKDRELQEKQEECRRLSKMNEQRWQESLGLQARLGALEAKSRELLVHQGSSVSGTSVALSALIGRLEGLVDELVTSYSISDQELEDVIFHNEAYSNSSSSPDATPEKSRKFFGEKTPSPKKGSSFVSAVINAIKNAAAQSPFAAHRDASRENLCTENSSPNEMLDSETEPCLMMEHVLEDVVVPDGHSHNMISSCHSLLSQSESLKDLSQAILSKHGSFGSSLSASFSNEMPSLCDIFPSLSLVDQVIDVDNLVTRLLKVIRIIQLENDDCMNELQEQRDSLSEQVDKQRENAKLVSKQLKDWEVLGARLKTEVKELMHQLSRKNNEIDNIKSELNKQREQVEKLNQDVCELSTALAKAELEMKVREEEVAEAVKNWEKCGDAPAPEVLGRLIMAHNEVPVLREKLAEKERHLSELTQEFLASRQVLTESLKEAVSEAKKQYEAIDNALEVLHSNQNVVQQCPPLAELQRDLENTSFQSASAMPRADCNANAALLQAIAGLQLAAPIDTTA